LENYKFFIYTAFPNINFVVLIKLPLLDFATDSSLLSTAINNVCSATNIGITGNFKCKSEQLNSYLANGKTVLKL